MTTDADLYDPHTPFLTFRPHCPPCRRLALLATVLSLFTIRRVPIDSPEELMLAQRYGFKRGQLALIYDQRVTTGPRVLLRAPLVVPRVWLRRLVALLNPPKTDNSAQAS